MTKNYEIKNGKLHISKANFRKVSKDYKNSTKGKERMMALDPKSGATTSYEVVFEEGVTMNRTEAWKIIGNSSKGPIRNMVRALSMHSWLNTAEENLRLEAGKICLKTTNPRYDVKGVK